MSGVTASELKEYYDITKQMSQLKKRRDSLNEKIKGAVLPTGESNLSLGGYKAVVSSQDKSKMDEEKLVQLLKDKDLKELIITKEVPDEAGVEQAVFDKKISAEELSRCVIPNIIYALKVVEDK